MAVYTDVSSRQLDVLLRDYELGSITSLRGIADGSENTNYFFSTERGSFILTLFENSIREDLSYPFKLTRFLSERGIPCTFARKTCSHRGCEPKKGPLEEGLRNLAEVGASCQ